MTFLLSFFYFHFDTIVPKFMVQSLSLYYKVTLKDQELDRAVRMFFERTEKFKFEIEKPTSVIGKEVARNFTLWTRSLELRPSACEQRWNAPLPDSASLMRSNRYSICLVEFVCVRLLSILNCRQFKVESRNRRPKPLVTACSFQFTILMVEIEKLLQQKRPQNFSERIQRAL